MKEPIHAPLAPSAIGPYSVAIKANDTVYLSGQIPLDPITMQLVTGSIEVQTEQVLKNLQTVCMAAGGDLNQIVKLTIFMINLADFAVVNEVMGRFFKQPYPARSTIQVSALPKQAEIEMDAVMVLSPSPRAC